MKYIILIISFSTLITFSESCKKNTANKENSDIPTSIAGSWELRQSSGGMMPGANDYPKGNGNILKFINTNYETYENGRLIKSGQYFIIRDTTVEANVCLVLPAGRYTNRIIYDSSYNTTKEFIEISNNKLTFISGCYAYDAGHSSEYERLENIR
jgi:hypothetical protein